MRSAFDDNFRWLHLSANPAVWTYCHTQEKFFDFRMVAVKLADKSLMIYSPLPVASDACWQELEAFGKVSYILAASHFHNLGVKPLLQRFPEAKILAANLASKRLKKVTGLTFSDCALLGGLLPLGVEIKQPEGLKTGDIWLTVKGEKATPILIVCDSFFNMTKPKKRPFALLMKLVKGAPGLAVSRMFRLLGTKDGKVYRKWMTREIKDLEPKILVPCHGEILKDEQLSKRLLALI